MKVTVWGGAEVKVSEKRIYAEFAYAMLSKDGSELHITKCNMPFPKCVRERLSPLLNSVQKHVIAKALGDESADAQSGEKRKREGPADDVRVTVRNRLIEVASDEPVVIVRDGFPTESGTWVDFHFTEEFPYIKNLDARDHSTVKFLEGLDDVPFTRRPKMLVHVTDCAKVKLHGTKFNELSIVAHEYGKVFFGSADVVNISASDEAQVWYQYAHMKLNVEEMSAYDIYYYRGEACELVVPESLRERVHEESKQ